MFPEPMQGQALHWASTEKKKDGVPRQASLLWTVGALSKILHLLAALVPSL